MSPWCKIQQCCIYYDKNLSLVPTTVPKSKQDVFVKHNAPDNGQFQRRPRSQGQIFWYQQKDLVTRNTHVKYGGSSMLSLRSYDQYQFFKKLVKCQGQKIKYLQKDLITRDIHVKYQNSSTHYSKVISKIKFLKNRSHSQVKVTRSKIMVPMNRSYHKEYSCKISKL